MKGYISTLLTNLLCCILIYSSILNRRQVLAKVQLFILILVVVANLSEEQNIHPKYKKIEKYQKYNINRNGNFCSKYEHQINLGLYIMSTKLHVAVDCWHEIFILIFHSPYAYQLFMLTDILNNRHYCLLQTITKVKTQKIMSLLNFSLT